MDVLRFALLFVPRNAFGRNRIDDKVGSERVPGKGGMLLFR